MLAIVVYLVPYFAYYTEKFTSFPISFKELTSWCGSWCNIHRKTLIKTTVCLFWTILVLKKTNCHRGNPQWQFIHYIMNDNLMVPSYKYNIVMDGRYPLKYGPRSLDMNLFFIFTFYKKCFISQSLAHFFLMFTPFKKLSNI